MADQKPYGESTPEEHRKSGYNLPASFYVAPTPSHEATPETEAADQEKLDAIDRKNAIPANIENKAVTPAAETKRTATKRGKK